MRRQEAALYRDVVAHARASTPDRPSIINRQIAAALTGALADVRLDSRTDGTPLFVNPLMAMYFTFDLTGSAARGSPDEDSYPLPFHPLEFSEEALRLASRVVARPSASWIFEIGSNC